jgi:hypothetical protein
MKQGAGSMQRQRDLEEVFEYRRIKSDSAVGRGNFGPPRRT